MQRPHIGFYFFMNQNNGAADAFRASSSQSSMRSRRPSIRSLVMPNANALIVNVSLPSSFIAEQTHTHVHRSCANRQRDTQEAAPVLTSRLNRPNRNKLAVLTIKHHQALVQVYLLICVLRSNPIFACGHHERRCCCTGVFILSSNTSYRKWQHQVYCQGLVSIRNAEIKYCSIE